ncbi:MAG: 50S ribosome-binding GTPase [Planctomycetia bacterium]|nr:50S ribosome-binding GTPase [Planctomycetia bacterium]
MHEAARPGDEPGSAVARLLTPPGEGGIAVIALEGAGAEGALARLLGRAAPGEGGIVRAWLAEDGRRLDEALAWRAGGRLEVGLHGGSAATAAVLRALRRAGVRTDPRAPGPESIEADAAALLPRAATLPAAMFLAAAADGALSREIDSRDPARLRALLERAPAGAALALPRTVAIAGPPNAGKSTLLNALAGRDRALVHPRAGTTRDPVEAVADFEGYPVRLVDTAGLGGALAGVDAEAEAQAREAARAADLVLWLEDPAAPSPPTGRADIRLSGKSDLGPAIPGALPVSGATGAGLPELRRAALRALGLPIPADARPAPFRPGQIREIEEALRSNL